MKYVEIDARNYYWRQADDNAMHKLKKRAKNDFVKKWVESTLRNFIINDMDALLYTKRVMKDDDPDYIKKALDDNQDVFAFARYNEYYNDFYHWIDYLNTLPPKPIKMSVKQVIEKVKEWDEKLLKINNIGKVEKVLQLGNLTWYQLLDADALKYESYFMKHCVGKDGTGYAEAVENGETQIYSLRDSKNVPHVTVEVTDNELIQCKGNSNKPFKEIYRKPVIALLNSLDNVVLESDEPLDDLIDNEIIIQDGQAHLLSEVKIDFSKPIPEKICQSLASSGKLPEKVIVENQADITIDKLNHDLEIECSHLTISNAKNVNIIVKSQNLALQDCNCSISGEADYVQASYSELKYNVHNTTRIRLHHTELKTKKIVVDRILCEDSTVYGKLKIRANSEILLNESSFATLDIQSNKYNCYLHQCKINNLIYSGDKLFLEEKTSIKSMKIRVKDLSVFRTNTVLNNVIADTISIESCNPSVKKVKTKKVFLHNTKLTESDFQ